MWREHVGLSAVQLVLCRVAAESVEGRISAGGLGVVVGDACEPPLRGVSCLGVVRDWDAQAPEHVCAAFRDGDPVGIWKGCKSVAHVLTIVAVERDGRPGVAGVVDLDVGEVPGYFGDHVTRPEPACVGSVADQRGDVRGVESVQPENGGDVIEGGKGEFALLAGWLGSGRIPLSHL